MISKTVLVLSEGFGDGSEGFADGSEGFADGLAADKVGSALARGLRSVETLDCDLCPVSASTGAPASVNQLLDELDFDRRLRAARCLVIAARRLANDTLAGSVSFEAATRARQGGVPAYAVSANDRLDPFEARILDLQVVLEASSPRALAAAGRRLAALV